MNAVTITVSITFPALGGCRSHVCWIAIIRRQGGIGLYVEILTRRSRISTVSLRISQLHRNIGHQFRFGAQTRLCRRGVGYFAELATVFADIQRYAQAIVVFWEIHVSIPVHALIVTFLNVELPLWLVEISTLAVFALGPVLRAVWTAHAMRSQIRQRFARLSELTVASAAHARQIENDKAARKEFQEAINSQNWDRAKSAFRILGGLAVGAASVLNFKPQHAGASIKGAQFAYKDLQSSAEKWKRASEEVARLNRSILEQTRELGDLQARTETLLSQDDGLLRTLREKSADEIKNAIHVFVAERMRIALLVSRISLGLVGAVVGAHALDWLL